MSDTTSAAEKQAGIPNNNVTSGNISQNFVFQHVPSLQPQKLPSIDQGALLSDLANISHSIQPELMDTSNDIDQLSRDKRMDGNEQVAAISNEDSLAASVHVPSYAAWFSLDQVHDIERHAFPEYFNGAHPSSEYVQMRNFIVLAYRKDPSNYITVTACRRHLSGDVTSIMKIHAFLEHWGLIHYSQVRRIAPPKSEKLNLQPSSTPSALQISGPKPAINLFLHPTAQATNEKPTTYSPSSNSSVPICNSCNILCSGSEFYHCLKIPSVNLCKPCFSDGRFSSSLFSGDFIRLPLNPSSTHSGEADPWTDQETLYLLEGLEMYGDLDWDQVSRHVGTRTKEECIRHFIQLPIQDPYLSLSTTTRALKDTSPQQQLSDVWLPFSSSSNPAMSLIHFLATLVHPSVASATAQAAISEYTKSNSNMENTSPSEPADGNANEGSTLKKDPSQLVSSLLDTAANRAEDVLNHEDEKIQKYIAVLVEAYLKKLDLKLKQFEQMEQFAQNEHAELEKQRLALYEERMRLIQRSSTSDPHEDQESDQTLGDFIVRPIDSSETPFDAVQEGTKEIMDIS
jgi:SWI/SNF related-matrix-associated actin-dependent regulator of chromatin subfamily C